jgi:hypothetical protein
MPSYYSPYNFYPVGYANQMGYSQMPMPQPTQMMPQQTQNPAPQLRSMEWVEGEVGAKAFQMPAGWPANQPIPLWDSTDTVIWLKSWGPMGIPNPMQKLRYTMPEQNQTSYLISGSTEAAPVSATGSNYATKDDINTLREEIRMMRQHSASRSAAGNQNGSTVQSSQNRGGNA